MSASDEKRNKKVLGKQKQVNQCDARFITTSPRWGRDLHSGGFGPRLAREQTRSMMGRVSKGIYVRQQHQHRELDDRAWLRDQ
jgi:hypothetical protein